MAERYCQFCGGLIQEDTINCPHCGKQVREVQYCKYCGTPMEKHMAFCPNCGKQVGMVTTEAHTQQRAPTFTNNTSSNFNTNTVGGGMYSDKNKLVALLLCIFLGYIGAHRFYVGKVGTGVLYLFTLGLFGIGTLIDLIMIIMGSFKDKNGMLLEPLG